MSTHQERRQQMPNSHIQDSADSFKAAWDLLGIQNPGSGFVLPQINVGAIAIELYLKSLSAFMIHTPDTARQTKLDDSTGGSEKNFEEGTLTVVTAKPTQLGHGLTTLFETIDADIQEDIKLAFLSKCHTSKYSFPEALAALEGAYIESRYSFELGHDISRYNLKNIENVVQLLHDFVSEMEVREFISFHNQKQER